MLFHSTDFVVFFIVVLALYHVLGRRWQNRLLLAASYTFYGWWDARFLALIFFSTVVDFVCALAIDRTQVNAVRKRYLAVSVAVNLGVLGVFKYFGFFLDNLVAVLNVLGLPAQSPAFSIVLPIGISFYTFQSMSYTIDVYRRQIAPTRRFFDFALYVAFFPQLVAGPIERARKLLPQLQRERRLDLPLAARSVQLILIGYVKKMVIADGIAPYVDEVFAGPAAHASPTLLLAAYLFAFQFYCDFSGYSDIARGTAGLLGIDLSVNFRQPFFAQSIADFWRRWHLSLSAWMRDYLFIPLGGNRSGLPGTCRNILIVMALVGLWHGASWNKILTFCVIGLGVVGQLLLGRTGPVRALAGRGGRLWTVAGVVLTFHFFVAMFFLFRGDSLAATYEYLRLAATGDWHTVSRTVLLYTAFFGALIFGLDWLAERSPPGLPIHDAWPAWTRGLAYSSLIGLLSFVGEPHADPFIYFQF